MGRLPLVQDAVVDEAKIRQYLLSSSHPTGRAKAAFFAAFGFTSDRWEELREALLAHATAHDGAKCENTAFGAKYVIDGTLVTPIGRHPMVRTVWFVSAGEEPPRLVTAYPLKEDQA